MTTSPAARLYVSRLLTDRAMNRVQALDIPVLIGGVDPPTRDELKAGFAGVEAAVVTITERVDADLIAAAGPQLKVIANVAVGYDNIDVAAAHAAGVTVTNTPGVLDGATADLTFALILALARRVTEADRFLRSQTPWVWGPRMLVGLDVSAGATLGVLGYGRIGRAVAKRAQAFDMRVLATTRHHRPGSTDGAVTFVDFDTLLADSDIVSVLTPLTAQTRHLIDAAALARMKPSAYLVNTARGGVVDEDALMAALRDGAIGGAALDVFENEPHVNPALLDVPNLLITPHIGSAGAATRDAMGVLAVDNAAAVLAGRPALNPVR